jgi:hypothetical protein
MQLGMVHPDRVSSEEMKDLWSEADHDGDGFVDYKEFQVNIVTFLRFMLNKKSNSVKKVEQTMRSIRFRT